MSEEGFQIDARRIATLANQIMAEWSSSNHKAAPKYRF